MDQHLVHAEPASGHRELPKGSPTARPRRSGIPACDPLAGSFEAPPLRPTAEAIAVAKYLIERTKLMTEIVAAFSAREVSGERRVVSPDVHAEDSMSPVSERIGLKCPSCGLFRGDPFMDSVSHGKRTLWYRCHSCQRTWYQNTMAAPKPLVVSRIDEDNDCAQMHADEGGRRSNTRNE
jgi:hypothetical protein